MILDTKSKVECFKTEISYIKNKYFDTSDLSSNEDSFYLDKDKWYIENSILTKFI